MKKLFTLGLFVLGFVFQQANAQIVKGEKMLGGSISIISSKTKYKNTAATDHEAHTLSVTPQLGFGLGNNWIVGLGVGYANSKNESLFGPSVSANKSSMVTPGIFVRKFHQFGDKFGIFGQADFEYGFGEQTTRQSNTPTYKSEIKAYSISASPGLYYRATKKFVVEAAIGSLGYTSTTTKPDGSNVEVKNSQLELSLTNSLSLGFRLIF